MAAKATGVGLSPQPLRLKPDLIRVDSKEIKNPTKIGKKRVRVDESPRKRPKSAESQIDRLRAQALGAVDFFENLEKNNVLVLKINRLNNKKLKTEAGKSKNNYYGFYNKIHSFETEYLGSGSFNHVFKVVGKSDVIKVFIPGILIEVEADQLILNRKKMALALSSLGEKIDQGESISSIKSYSFDKNASDKDKGINKEWASQDVPLIWITKFSSGSYLEKSEAEKQDFGVQKFKLYFSNLSTDLLKYFPDVRPSNYSNDGTLVDTDPLYVSCAKSLEDLYEDILFSWNISELEMKKMAAFMFEKLNEFQKNEPENAERVKFHIGAWKTILSKLI